MKCLANSMLHNQMVNSVFCFQGICTCHISLFPCLFCVFFISVEDLSEFKLIVDSHFQCIEIELIRS